MDTQVLLTPREPGQRGQSPVRLRYSKQAVGRTVGGHRRSGESKGDLRKNLKPITRTRKRWASLKRHLECMLHYHLMSSTLCLLHK